MDNHDVRLEHQAFLAKNGMLSRRGEGPDLDSVQVNHRLAAACENFAANGAGMGCQAEYQYCECSCQNIALHDLSSKTFFKNRWGEAALPSCFKLQVSVHELQS